MAKLCEVCSKLDIHLLTHPIYPCRKSLPCSTPPIDKKHLALGSVDEIKRRCSTCDICRLVAEELDKEPADLDGECRIKEVRQFCNFKLPGYIKARDPSITHFHLTQSYVVFDPYEAEQFQGPVLPHERKESHGRRSRYALNLQVKARLDAAAPSTSLQTEEEFLDTIGGRYVSTQINAQLIRAWLHQCETKHGKDCMPTLHSAEGNRKPTLVVDVIHSCLVETPPQCRYVALSYVWGTAPVFTHLVENTKDLRKVDSLRSLPIPSTIRDAITLVRAIGERYLWVDSLCIIQNDWKMKDTEIMRMGSIYLTALFTIIAAAGDHANSGLPGVEPGTRKQVQKSMRLADRELMTVIDLPDGPLGSRINSSTWAERAWTFQERVLSNRLLVFSEDQVHWSCRAASHSEERTLGDAQDIDWLEKPFAENYIVEWLSWHRMQPSEYCSLYYDFASSYRQRRLTYQTDILNAFNGVSEILAGLQDDRFLWGFPESLFSYAMVWSFMGPSERNHVTVPLERRGAKEMIPIPSWSWAAWSGKDPDHPPFLQREDTTYIRPVTCFDIVDKEHQLVRIKERSWPDYPPERARALWGNEQVPHLQVQPHAAAQHPPLVTGQLHFWTSYANVSAVRSWGIQGPGSVDYTLFPPPNFRPNPGSSMHYRTELVHQDFIVVAASRRLRSSLVLLAIDWKDGVAYRIGSASVPEAAWAQVENKQWRLIVLG